jgi:hypothetical protein
MNCHNTRAMAYTSACARRVEHQAKFRCRKTQAVTEIVDTRWCLRLRWHLRWRTEEILRQNTVSCRAAHVSPGVAVNARIRGFATAVASEAWWLLLP